MLHCPQTPIRKRALCPPRLLCGSFQTLICTWQGHQLLKNSVLACKPNLLTPGSVGHQICSFRFFSLLFPLDDQPRNQEFKYQAFKNQVSSTNFNSLNSLITLQVQEFKLQAQEHKFQAQAFQVSSPSFKSKTEKRFYITLTLKRGQRPKSFSQP